MAVVVVEAESGWKKKVQMAGGKHEHQHQHQSSNSNNSSIKSEDSCKPSTSFSSGVKERSSKKRGWGEEFHKALLLMLGQGQMEAEKETRDFLGVSGGARGAEVLELDPNLALPLPVGWEKCLDLRSGCVYFFNRSTGVKTGADPREHAGVAPSSGSCVEVEAERSSDCPTSAAVNFFCAAKCKSPSQERAIESSSPSRAGSGLFLASSLSTVCLATERGEGAAAPMPWALEHWAAAANRLTERNAVHAGPELSLKRLQVGSGGDGSHPVLTMAAKEEVWEWRSQGLNERSSKGEELRELGSSLDLKLSSSGSAEQRNFLAVKDEGRSVCTMEKVREALLRSDKVVVRRATVQPAGLQPSRQCKASQPLLNSRSPPSSPSDSSSSASSSSPPSDSHKSLFPDKVNLSWSQNMGATSCRASPPNCLSSSSNVSSPVHPSCASPSHGRVVEASSKPLPPPPPPPPPPPASRISPNLASLKLQMERGCGEQVLGLGSSSASTSLELLTGAGDGPPPAAAPAAVALGCCQSCLMYVMMWRQDPRCPRCHNSVIMDLFSAAPWPKKAKVEVDV